MYMIHMYEAIAQMNDKFIYLAKNTRSVIESVYVLNLIRFTSLPCSLVYPLDFCMCVIRATEESFIL